ncbi:hypothetical protein [Catellatospora sp. TT07R-123]
MPLRRIPAPSGRPEAVIDADR